MTVRVYKHTDASAPTLTGQAGSLIALLDACLVNGYGALPAAGWAKSFSGTNKAAYRQGTGGNGHYLRVDAAATSSARLVGYEAMTDVDTGTGPFPTEAQIAGGGYMLTSSTADATARPWLLVATEKAFYLWVGYSITVAAGIAGSAVAMPMMFFGNIQSHKTGDAYATLIACGNSNAITGNVFAAGATALSGASLGHYLARSYTQIGGSVAAGKTTDNAKKNTNATFGAAGATYPDPVSGGLLMGGVFVTETGQAVTRGTMPGLYDLFHNLPGSPGDTFSGAGALSGKSFILLDVANGGTRGRIALETSDTW